MQRTETQPPILRRSRGRPVPYAMVAATIRRARGAANGNARLTDDQARAIRAGWNAGLRKIDLARHYGVSWDAIDKIVREETWRYAGVVSFVEGLDG